jgi:hypothetical protein
VPLAKPYGIFSVAQYKLCRLCLEGSQSASINDPGKSSNRKTLISLGPQPIVTDFVVLGKHLRPC